MKYIVDGGRNWIQPYAIGVAKPASTTLQLKQDTNVCGSPRTSNGLIAFTVDTSSGTSVKQIYTYVTA